MSAARRPAAGRRPAASRGRTGRAARTAARRIGRAAARPEVAPHGPRPGLTHRAAVLGLVVTTLVLSAALPLRELLDQRSQISRLQQEAAAAEARVAALEEAKRQLQDPAHIAAEARRRLHMARPGEVAYLLIQPEPQPAAGPGQADAGPDAPWWAQVWSSVQTADRPAAPAEDAGSPQPAPPQPQAP